MKSGGEDIAERASRIKLPEVKRPDAGGGAAAAEAEAGRAAAKSPARTRGWDGSNGSASFTRRAC